MKATSYLTKTILYIGLTVFLTHCSGGGSSATDSSNPDEPPGYKKNYCTLLIKKVNDKKVAFLRGYSLYSAVDECTYNQKNNIEGPCDSDNELNILQYEEQDQADDLIIDQDKAVTILPSDGKHYICLHSEGVAISTKYVKLILKNEDD